MPGRTEETGGGHTGPLSWQRAAAVNRVQRSHFRAPRRSPSLQISKGVAASTGASFAAAAVVGYRRRWLRTLPINGFIFVVFMNNQAHVLLCVCMRGDRESERPVGLCVYL